MPFKFRLQTVLNIKKQMEESMKNELGKAIQRLEYEKSMQKNIENFMDDCISNFNNLTTNGITVDKLREYSAYIPVLKEKLQMQKKRVSNAEVEVENARRALVKAMQEREMLDKLKEKQMLEFREEEIKNEQKQIDEIVSYKTGLVTKVQTD